MSALRLAWLALAVLGAVQPLLLYAGYFRHGGSLSALPAAWRAAAFAGPGWTSLVAALALVLWILAETAVRRNWSALAAIPATAVLGLGCGLPLYLLLRTRPVACPRRARVSDACPNHPVRPVPPGMLQRNGTAPKAPEPAALAVDLPASRP